MDLTGHTLTFLVAVCFKGACMQPEWIKRTKSIQQSAYLSLEESGSLYTVSVSTILSREGIFTQKTLYSNIVRDSLLDT